MIRTFSKVARRLSLLHWRVRWRIAGVMVPRRVVESRGLRFTLQCDNWITHYRWQTYNTKEPETHDWIDRWVGAKDIFFDIGANIGLYTIYAALRYPGMKVVAFEPEFANLHLLRDNILNNRLQDVVDAYSIALSDHEGPSHLHVQDPTPGAALHSVCNGRLEETRAGRRVVWREGVWETTLDAFCRMTGLHPQAVKIDVDGTEMEILQGGRMTFSAPTMRSVIIEMPHESAARQRCEGLLTAAGLTREWRNPERQNEIWVRR